MINYLEDYQLDELKSYEGTDNTFYANYGSPTGAGKIVKVGDEYTEFVSVVKEYCKNPKGEVGVVFFVPNRIVYNIIG